MNGTLATPKMPWMRTDMMMDQANGEELKTFCCASVCWGIWCCCCPPCIPCWVSKMFMPAPISSYKLIPNGQFYRMQIDPDFPLLKGRQISLPTVEKLICSYVTTAKGNRLAMAHLHHPNPLYTVILSHANAEDLGSMADTMEMISTMSQCEVVAYDYSGYGVSEGLASEGNFLSDIEAVLNQLELPADRVILWGLSLGSAPTLLLAAKTLVRGVIVEGGFSSAKDFVCPPDRCCCLLNQFRNVDVAKKVLSPTLVIHARDDDMISFSQAERLFNQLPNAVEPLWLDEGGHLGWENNVEYQQRVRHFLRKEVGKSRPQPINRQPTSNRQSLTQL